jgi:hypothetical protein
MTKLRDLDCCLCGLPYERIGNNPAPLSMKPRDRCCDACNEVAICARIDMDGFVELYERIEQAMLRRPNRAAMAAVCAAIGPPLLAERKAATAKLMEMVEAEKAKEKIPVP